MNDSTLVTPSSEASSRRIRDNSATGSDQREQLCNAGESGPIDRVQLAEVNITSLNAIMLDLDPDLLAPQAFGIRSFRSPDDFYMKAIHPMLDRHPTLKKAHVRASGRGLHVLLKLAEPVEFENSEERDRWSGIVQVVQCLLPADPRCPGITAVTRPIGSVNSKNGAVVKELAPGEPIAANEIEELVDAYKATPFRTVASVLWAGMNSCLVRSAKRQPANWRSWIKMVAAIRHAAPSASSRSSSTSTSLRNAPGDQDDKKSTSC